MRILLAFTVVLSLGALAQVNPHLYSVTRRGYEPSFLFGTVHIIVPPEEFPEYFWKAFDSRKHFAFEILTAEDNDKPSIVLPDPPPPLPQPSPAAEKELRARGLPDYLFTSPYVCTFYFGWEPRQIPYLDKLLELRAREKQRPTYRLDPPFNPAAMETITKTANECNIEQLTQMFPAERLIKNDRDFLNRYKSGHPENGIYSCPMGSHCESRTLSWLDPIETLLTKDSGAFISVGVGHIGGERGLINELQRRGYRVERVNSVETVDFLLNSTGANK
jgi:uncharacterized protein YbaP (TraB family)